MSSCVFLNLPSASQRRADVEASFAGIPHEGWNLHRFEAHGPAAVSDIPGVITAAEKACFASHRAAIESRVGAPGHLFVTEDDVAFTTKTFGALDQLLAARTEWDVIFTDAALFDVGTMIQLARRREDMVARTQTDLIDLKQRNWAGATAYCVRDSAKGKVLEALRAAGQLDQPFDLFLRALVNRGVVTAALCFPYLTSLSADASGSQIQARQHAGFDMLFNAFRRLMCVERELAQSRQDLDALSAVHGAEDSALVGAVFGLLASPRLELR